MNVAMLIVALIVGMALGAFYFGGLWITVCRIPTMPMPAIWLALSFAVRTAVVLSGFYIVAAGSWERLVLSVAGFLIARMLLIRHLRWRGESRFQTGPGGSMG